MQQIHAECEQCTFSLQFHYNAQYQHRCTGNNIWQGSRSKAVVYELMKWQRFFNTESPIVLQGLEASVKEIRKVNESAVSE